MVKYADGNISVGNFIKKFTYLLNKVLHCY